MIKILITISILTYTLNLHAQTQTKNHLIDGTYHQWRINEYDCIDKWSVTFENKTQKNITSITFKLIIKEIKTGIVLYKKTHTVYLNISSDEIVPSPYFNLTQELCGLYNIEDLEEYDIYTEVIGFK
jgi:hypothetical protein